MINKDLIIKNEAFLSLIFYSVLFISSFFLGFYLLGGFQVGFSVPLSYTDDGLFVLLYVKLLLAGHWSLSSQNLAYPLGMNLCDFPGSDFGNRAFFILSSLFTKDPVVAFNLYAYLSFPITACATFFLSKKIGLTKVNSIVLSTLFAFSTFSIQRLMHFGHLVYMCNFVVPIFFYLGYFIYNYEVEEKKDYVGWKKLILTVFVLILLSSFGVYYAFFGCLILTGSGILGTVRFYNFRNFLISMIACCVVFIGFLINMIPTVINSIQNGKNNEIAVRNAGETDIYSLRLTQMLVPHSDHRLKLFRNINKKYTETFTFINENKTSSLGLIGGLGFLISIFVILFLTELNVSISPLRPIRYFSIIGGILFFYGVTGGFGSMFSFIAVPIFRGVNRVSIFISLSSLIVFFLFFQQALETVFKNNTKKYLIMIFVLLIGIFDQTFKIPLSYLEKNKMAYLNDKYFVEKIEGLMNPGGAVFQFPYMAFPEVPPISGVETYGLARGPINSNTIKWSYGAIKGRKADDLFKVLSEQDITKQLELIRSIGFNGIYIDRRGFTDQGLQIEQQIEQFLKIKPSIVSLDNNLSFFLITNPILNKNNPFEVMDSMGIKIYRDKLGIRVVDDFSKRVDFKKIAIPSFIKEMKGLSYKEDWGQWSDATKYKNVYIEFDCPLEENIELIISAKAFGPNVGLPFKIKIGSDVQFLVLGPNIDEFKLSFENIEKASVLEIFSPNSVSPQDLGIINGDFRKLGIGIEKLSLIKTNR
jgi:phosphoglycerol transferase